MQKGQMSNEDPYSRNFGSGPRFYDGQLGSIGGNQTRGGGGGRRGGFSGRSANVTEIAGGVPRRAGGVQGRGVRVLKRGVRVLRNGHGVLGRGGGVPGRGAGVLGRGAGVPGRGAGVPGRARGVLVRGAGVLSREAGVLRRGGGVPGRLGGVPRLDGVSVGTSGVSGFDGSCRVNQRGENVSMRAPGNMGRYMFSYNGIKKGEIASRSDSATGNLDSRSPEVQSSLLTRGGGYGLNGGSSFTSRGSFVRKGQDRVALKRGFGMNTTGGALGRGGIATVKGVIGMSGVGGIRRIGAIAAVKNDTREIQLTQGVTRDVQLTQGVTGGVLLTQGVARGVQLTQGMTRGVQITQGVGDMARTSGMGMGRGGLNSSGGAGMNKGRGESNGAIGVTRNGVFNGTRVTATGGRGRNGAVGVTRDGGISGSRVIARGGRGCNGATRKYGNSTAGVMSGGVPHSEKISTPDDTTSNTIHIKREMEVIDLDETADIVEEKSMINVQNVQNVQNVNQEPLSEEDIRDRYYGRLNNFEENCFDMNSNKIGDQLTVMKTDADGSLKLVMKATVNPNISVSIVNDSSNKNKYQGCEQSETDDKVMKDNIKIDENDTVNTECIKNVDKVETDDIKDEDITNDSVSMSVSRNTKNTGIYKKPTELASFVETGNTVNVDDVMEASNRLEISDKTKPNPVMFKNSIESNNLQVEDSWVDIDAVKLIIEGAGLKPFNMNGEEILFERRIDVTESDQNCYILEVNPVTKGNSENNNVTCIADNSPVKSPNQITVRSQYQMEAPKRMNISSENMEMDSDLFSINEQSWKERNSSMKPPSQMVQYRPKSLYEVKVSQKKCFINLEKLNISPGNHFMEVDGVSYKVHQESWKGNPNNNDTKEKNVVKNRSNKSWIWKYMTQKPATGGFQKAFCNLCSKSIIRIKGSNNTLLTHLRCCHDEDIEANERTVNYWMLLYANQVTETGKVVSSSGSVPGGKRYVCKLCSKTVAISHFLQNFKWQHRDKLKAM